MTIKRHQPLLQEIHTEYRKYVEESTREGGERWEREWGGREVSEGRGGREEKHNQRMFDEAKDGRGGRV